MKGKNNISQEKIPVTFNPYKHHLGFLREKVGHWQKMDWQEAEKEIRLIGNNLIDLYFGVLKIDDIVHETLSFAEKNNLTSAANLVQWLYPMDYRKTEFSDGSMWVIKQGQNNNRFLHIHPGKYSPFTIRVKATALKTVIALKVYDNSIVNPHLVLVNTIRVEKLNLSPVKSLVAGKGIARLLNDFNSM